MASMERAKDIFGYIYFRSTSGPRRIDTVNTTASFKSSGNSQQGSSVRNIGSRKSGVGPGGIDLGDEDMREDFKFK